MALDPSIILGAKTLDVNALYDQAQQARAQEQAAQLNALKLQEASQAMEERNKMRALFARPGFSMESPEAVQQMYQVSPEMGMKFQAEQADRQYKLNQAKKLDLELKGQQYNKSIGEIVNYTNAQDALAALERNAANLDPNKYQSLKAELAAIGNDPAQFKSWRNKTLMGILDAKDQIHAQQQEITLAETGRHNRATEATARGQLGVAQGQLGLARQRETREAATAGKAPAGYRWTPQGNLEPIPGGPAFAGETGLTPKQMQQREATRPKATLALNTTVADFKRQIDDLKRLRDHKGLNSISGLVGSRTLDVSGDARAARALFNKISAKGMFTSLQNLRNSSPTGGALGNVSNQEGQALKDSYAAIDLNQDAKDIRANIDRAIQDTEGAISRLTDSYGMTYGYQQPSAPVAAPARPAASGKPNVQSLLDKYK